MSIMCADLSSILEDLFYNSTWQVKKCVVLTDSRSSLRHLERCSQPNFRGCPVVYEIFRLLYQVRSNAKNIVLLWVPSHIRIIGNDTVDNLAKEASIEGHKKYTCTPYFVEVLYLVKEHCYNSMKDFLDLRSFV